MEEVGLDTGFFVRVLEGDRRATAVWEKIIKGEVRATTSSLTIFELKRLFHKLGRITEWDSIRKAILLNCKVAQVDISIAEEGASISHGTGLPAIDALIYASTKHADEFYTTDESFSVLNKKKPKIMFL